MTNLVVIVGPTAVGKSRLGVLLAQALEGEVVSADSRQIYRLMDIGTAKPTAAELSMVPHHMIDIISPDGNFSLAQYQGRAYKTISAIEQRDHLPLLVGGSGQYVWSVVEGWNIPAVPPNPELRTRLEQKAAQAGKETLYQELVSLDPASARDIGPNNVRRMVRALEVFESTGVPFSQLKKKQAPPYRVLIVGLTLDRAELYRRIDLRVDAMIEAGLVAEVAALLEKGYAPSLPAMSGIGYEQIARYLRDEISLPEAVRQVKVATHRLARQQYNWFRLKDKRISWFDAADKKANTEIKDLVTGFVAAVPQVKG